MPQMHTFVEHEAAFPGLIPFLLLSWHQSSSLCWGLQAGAAPRGGGVSVPLPCQGEHTERSGTPGSFQRIGLAAEPQAGGAQ